MFSFQMATRCDHSVCKFGTNEFCKSKMDFWAYLVNETDLTDRQIIRDNNTHAQPNMPCAEQS